MNTLLRSGRYTFAIAIGAFGIQYLMYVHYPGALINIPPYTVQAAPTAIFAGTSFVLASLSFATGKKGRIAALLLGAALLLNFLIFHVARILSNMQSGNIRTRGFETLAFAGTAFVLAAAFPAEQPASRSTPIIRTMAQAGRFFVVVALAIFGVQHFMYHDFIASLIPAWMPARLFLAYFTGCAFLAAALSIAMGRVTRLAGALLAAMFLIWVMTLHGPRVARALNHPNEWSSMLVALCMSGVGFMMAGAFGEKRLFALHRTRNSASHHRQEKRVARLG